MTVIGECLDRFGHLASKHVTYPLWLAREGESRVLRYMREFEEVLSWPRLRIEDLQTRRLRAIVRHAYETTPYYRDRFDRAGVKVEMIKDPTDLRLIPRLTKEDLRHHAHDLMSRHYPLGSLFRSATGGSTATPIRFYQDTDSVLRRVAHTHVFNRWYGLDLGEKMALLWGAAQDLTAIDSIKDRVKERYIFRRMILPCARLDEGMLDLYVRRLREFRPTLLRGYTNSLFALAQYILATKSEVPLEAVVSAAEPLYPFQRPVIEEAFGAPLFEQYGSREAGLMASECQAHGPLHVDAASICLEIVDRGGKAGKDDRIATSDAGASREGEILVTDLFNYGMPLLRYAIGDLGRWDGDGCGCGAGLPALAQVSGRVTDSILTPDGTLVSGAALTVYLVADRPGFKQLQVVQERLEGVTVRIVPSESYTESDMEYLRRQLRRFLGTSMKIDYRFESEIPKEASGKYRYVVSSLWSSRAESPGAADQGDAATQGGEK
ncbi:hypothetical protein AMJ71_03145 [candidate division TA06 bacterium SM1_40]|uniref:Capsule biosynthesis protein CapK n=2 Tax=Bacteria division TA06 TaxID=1156500 RepID=A0A0S8JKX9_UNCT6|nr:MAG: hypothetical protein AMJ82_05845 [candidate division TA06 bacterium SM23_40]KPL10422.1 MAG: hypothetical protein AMJ71_03145 [candidate division TA06 bacterium SM1_40]